MREIKQEDIIQTVKTLCIEANYQLPQDVRNAIDQASQIEDGQLAKQTLSILKEEFSISCS